MAPRPEVGLGSALLPIGAVAFVAGCSGGSVSSNGAYVPPSRGTATVQISLTIPASSSSLLRKAQTINSATNAIGVRIVASPAPAVTPTEASFTIASGPVPTSTTLTVTGVSGPDTVYVTGYGAVAGLSRGPIDGAFQNVTLAANGTNSLSMTMNPVAYGASISVSGGAGQISSNAQQWSPFENWTSDQTGSFSVAPYDAFANPITGAIGNVLNVSGPSGVTAPGITAAGTASVTFSKGSNGVGSVTLAPSLVPSGAVVAGAPASSAQTVSLLPDYYLFGVDVNGNVAVYDPFRALQIGTAQINNTSASRRVLGGPQQLHRHRRLSSQQRSAQSLYSSVGISAMDAASASNCSGGSVAAVSTVVGSFPNSGNAIDVVTVSPSGTVSYAFVTWPGAGPPTSVSLDPSTCLAYVGDSSGYLGVVQGTTTGSPSLTMVGGASPVSIASGNAIVSLQAANGSLYVAANNTSLSTTPLGSPPSGALSPVSSFTGSVSFFNNPGLVLAGGTVYAFYLRSSPFNCLFQAINGSTTVASYNNNTFYQIAGAQSGIYGADTNGNLESFTTPLGPAPAVLSSACFSGVAVSKDAQNSTLWVASPEAGVCAAYSLPLATTPTPFTTFSPHTIGADLSPTGLAIAP
jgi:hypothetical protein